MLADAIMSIRRANETAKRRRNALLARRLPILLVDRWLGEVETLVETKHEVVPEPLITEISAFLERLDSSLYLRLRKNRQRSSLKVLDVLFDAEEQLLVVPTPTA